VTQINPPFDGSSPCPMCQSELVGVAAIMHNAHNRIGDASLIEKLDDLLRFHSEPLVLSVPHPATEALAALHQEMIVILRQGTSYPEPQRIRWAPETRPAIMRLLPRWREIMGQVELLSEAHFEDDRHCRGTPNILRAEQGGKSDFWGNGNGGSYNHTVEVVEAGTGDIAHTPCGTELKLHEHFKERIRRDLAFYGKVWCPTCVLNAPIAQFAFAQSMAKAA
jgi:hypothetical protein